MSEVDKSIYKSYNKESAHKVVDSSVCESLEGNGWSKPFDWRERYTKEGYSVYKIESPISGWHVEKSLPGNKVKHLGNYLSLEKAKRFVDNMVDKPYIELDSAEEAYAVIKTAAPYGAKAFTVVGDRATAAKVAKIKNRTLGDDSKHTYIYRKMDEVNSEKYNIPVNEGVGKMKGLVDKLLALGQETAPANENYAEAGPNSQRLLSQLDNLDGKTLAEELINWMSDDEVGRFAKEYGYFPDPDEDDNVELGAEEDLADKEESSYILNDSQKEFLWNELDMADVYSNDPDSKYSKFETAKEGEWRLDRDSDPDYPWALFVDTAVWDSITDGLAKKVLEISSEQPVDDSQSLDEEQGKPVKSATELEEAFEEYEKGNKEAGDSYLKEADRLERVQDNSGGRVDNSEEIEKLELAAKEEFDQVEKEMFEAMNRNSITGFQASVSDSISRIGSLGTIQLLLDSGLADSFEDELFFIKNTYDLSDTQLVAQAILDAGETLLEDGELERAMETLKNSSEEENEEEFGEYEEPEDWSEVDQVEEDEVEEPIEEGEPAEGGEITEEETEFEEDI